MPCAEFEDLIIEHAQSGAGLSRAPERLRVHLAGCEDCRAALEFHTALDARLARTIVVPELSPAFDHRLRLSLADEPVRVNRLPQILDWCGYATVAIAGGLLLHQHPDAVAYLVGTVAAASFGFGVWQAIRTVIPHRF